MSAVSATTKPQGILRVRLSLRLSMVQPFFRHAQR